MGYESDDSRMDRLNRALAYGDHSQAVSLLSTRSLSAYQAEFDRKQKNTGIAYLYFFLLGVFGAHKFYMGSKAAGFAYLAVTIGGVAVLIIALMTGLSLQSFSENGAAGIGLGGVLFFGACLLVYAGMHTFDLFTMPMQVEKVNNAIRINILYDLASLAQEDEREQPRPKQRSQPVQSAATRKCPYCAEIIQPEAVFCRHCRQNLTTEVQEPVDQTFEPSFASRQAATNSPEALIQQVATSPSSNAPKTVLNTKPFYAQKEKSSNNSLLVVSAVFVVSIGFMALLFFSSQHSTALIKTNETQSSFIEQMLDAQQPGNGTLENQLAEEIEKAKKPSPGKVKEAEHANQIGLKFLKQKNYSKAAQQFASAAAHDPSVARYFSNLGFAQTYAGDFAAAKKSLFASVALAPRRPVAWGDLGVMFAKMRQQEKAVNSLLIGYEFSEGKTANFLKSLVTDDDAGIAQAGQVAVQKLGLSAPTNLTATTNFAPADLNENDGKAADAAESGSQQTWAGNYEYTEVFAPGQLVEHKLNIRSEGGILKASLVSQGFQTDETLLCDTEISGNRLTLLFKSYPNGNSKNEYGVEMYKPGTELLSIERKTSGKRSTLQTVFSDFERDNHKYSPKAGLCFRRVDGGSIAQASRPNNSPISSNGIIPGCSLATFKSQAIKFGIGEPERLSGASNVEQSYKTNGLNIGSVHWNPEFEFANDKGIYRLVCINGLLPPGTNSAVLKELTKMYGHPRSDQEGSYWKPGRNVSIALTRTPKSRYQLQFTENNLWNEFVRGASPPEWFQRLED